MPTRLSSNTGPHKQTRNIIFTLGTKGIRQIMNPTMPAHISPSIQFRRRKPNIRLESNILSGIAYSISFSFDSMVSPFYI